MEPHVPIEIISQNGWSKNERYVNQTLSDLKNGLSRVEQKVDELALEFAYHNGRTKTLSGLISAGVSGAITVMGMWLERLIYR